MSHHVAGALGSKWGNPFKVQRAEKNSRKNCLKRYEDHIRSDPKLFSEIMELEGKELGCWCKPSPCHGDILIKLFKERQSKNPLKSDYQASTPMLTQCGSNGDDGDDCCNTDCVFENVFNSGDVVEGTDSCAATYGGTPSMFAPLRLNGGGIHLLIHLMNVLLMILNLFQMKMIFYLWLIKMRACLNRR